MQILLHRKAGWMGRFASLDVLVNEQKVCAIEGNETKSITLPDNGGTLRVEMQSAVSSTSVRIDPEADGHLYECGSAWWVPFDFLSLCYLGFLKHRVFYVQPASALPAAPEGRFAGKPAARP